MKKQMSKQILDKLVKPLLNQTAPETQLFLDSLVIDIPIHFLLFFMPVCLEFSVTWNQTFLIDAVTFIEHLLYASHSIKNGFMCIIHTKFPW